MKASEIILSVPAIKMGHIPEMATALGSPLVWATYAILDSKQPKNDNFLPPARSTKIYLGNGSGGNQCLLKTPPVTSEQRMRKRIWTNARVRSMVVVDSAVHSLQEQAAEEDAPYLRRLSPPLKMQIRLFVYITPSQGHSQSAVP